MDQCTNIPKKAYIVQFDWGREGNWKRAVVMAHSKEAAVELVKQKYTGCRLGDYIGGAVEADFVLETQ